MGLYSTCSRANGPLCTVPCSWGTNHFGANRFLHTAVISHGFTTPTTVYYAVGSKASQSATASFVTAQTPGTDTFLVIFADLGE